MSRYKRLVLTLDAFGTIFTPRESIGQQYVCTSSVVFPPLGTLREALKRVSAKALSSLVSCCSNMCDEKGNADSEG